MAPLDSQRLGRSKIGEVVKKEGCLEENYTDEPLDLDPAYETICAPLHTCPPMGTGVEADFNNQVVLYMQ